LSQASSTTKHSLRGRQVDVGDPDHSFAGRIKDARIYDQPLDRETIAALQPGQVAGDLKPWEMMPSNPY
jgi:hypothetical protein